MTPLKRFLLVVLCLFAARSLVLATDVTGPLTFVGVTPCRIIETRGGQGFSDQAGPPALIANQQRTFQITGTVPGLPKQCGIPSTAVAISVNFTVTGFSSGGDLRIFPAGSSVPLASIINFQQENVANATNLPLGAIPGKTEKGFTVQADGASTQFIADVNGYFVPRPITALESGQTLRGTYSIDFTAHAASEPGTEAIVFQIPLATAPAASNANFIPLGGSATTNCPGDSSNPLAAKGQVCVYESQTANVGSRCLAKVGGAYWCTYADVFGTTVFVTSAGAGRVVSVGTWAVTAP